MDSNKLFIIYFYGVIYLLILVCYIINNLFIQYQKALLVISNMKY